MKRAPSGRTSSAQTFAGCQQADGNAACVSRIFAVVTVVPGNIGVRRARRERRVRRERRERKAIKVRKVKREILANKDLRGPSSLRERKVRTKFLSYTQTRTHAHHTHQRLYINIGLGGLLTPILGLVLGNNLAMTRITSNNQVRTVEALARMREPTVSCMNDTNIKQNHEVRTQVVCTITSQTSVYNTSTDTTCTSHAIRVCYTQVEATTNVKEAIADELRGCNAWTVREVSDYLISRHLP